MTSRNDIEAEARRLANKGLGWEDILVRLKHLGVTKSYARSIVFNLHQAQRLRRLKEAGAS